MHFSSEVKISLGSKLLKQGEKGRNHGMGLAAESQPAGRWHGGTLVAEGAGEAGQAVAVSGHVVTGPVAVHALGTRLAAVVAVKTRGAN